MARSIFVLNAGSSSLKFSIFLDGDPPTAFVRGQLEGLFTLPHFVARNADGAVIGEREWPSGTQLGHTGAVEFLFQWGRTTLGKQNIVAAGHRVGHGGRKFTRPVLVDAKVMQALEAFVPLAPCISHIIWERFEPSHSMRLHCHKWPVSIPPSIACSLS